VLLAGSDDIYYEPGKSGSIVEVTGGRLTVPLLDRARSSNIPGGPSRKVIERTSFPAPVAGRESDLALPRRARARGDAKHFRKRTRHRRVRR
jgi:hypothetical protein